jgi:hypothetical protein
VAPVQPAGATTPPVRTAEEGCAFSRESAEKGEIVVCAQRPETYRLNPDVMAAKKAMRNGGAPKGPERFKDDSCRTVGPRGCSDAGINLIAAAVTAAKMADKLSKGESVKSMFVTDPHPTEYQLYIQAKREREAKEEEAETSAAVKQASAGKGETAR